MRALLPAIQQVVVAHLGTYTKVMVRLAQFRAKVLPIYADDFADHRRCPWARARGRARTLHRRGISKAVEALIPR